MTSAMSDQQTALLQWRCDARGIYWLTLNRPQRANALNGELVSQLAAVISRIKQDQHARLMVLTGQGDVFCGGADLTEMQRMADASPSYSRQDALSLALMLESLASLPVPTLARVNGSAYGGAIGLIAACDIAIACDSSRFAFSEVTLGLLPAVITPYVVAAIGLRQTQRWFLSGEGFSAQQAFAMGLVHRLLPAENLDEGINQQLTCLLNGGPQAQRALKRWLAQWRDGEPASAERCAEQLADIRSTEEAHEGLSAFFEKRQPQWVKGENS